MTKISLVGLIAMALAAMVPGRAGAQVVGPRVGSPSPAPTVSPYINLLRNPNAPALNYYGLVRPQFQTNAGLQSLQQQFLLGQSTSLPGSEATGDVLITGHAATFLNYGGYFQSSVGAFQPARLGTAAASRPTSAATPTAPRLPAPGPR